jgi:hypothetical protein
MPRRVRPPPSRFHVFLHAHLLWLGLLVGYVRVRVWVRPWRWFMVTDASGVTRRRLRDRDGALLGLVARRGVDDDGAVAAPDEAEVHADESHTATLGSRAMPRWTALRTTSSFPGGEACATEATTSTCLRVGCWLPACLVATRLLACLVLYAWVGFCAGKILLRLSRFVKIINNIYL